MVLALSTPTGRRSYSASFVHREPVTELMLAAHPSPPLTAALQHVPFERGWLVQSLEIATGAQAASPSPPARRPHRRTNGRSFAATFA